MYLYIEEKIQIFTIKVFPIYEKFMVTWLPNDKKCHKRCIYNDFEVTTKWLLICNFGYFGYLKGVLCKI